MRRLWLTAFWLFGSVVLAHAAGISPPSPIGRWLSADNSIVVQIAPCGGGLCGQIVGITLAHPDDPMPMDWLGQPLCGTTIIQTAPVTNAATGIIHWIGTVLDPRSGSIYHASIGLDANQHLRLHGWWGLPIFGQTQTWAHYSGRTLAGCRLATETMASGG